MSQPLASAPPVPGLYTEHFGLRLAPFSATPDPRFLYSNARYDEAYATLLYGVLGRQGFIVLTGEVGTGKTTLLRRLMDEMSGRARFVFCYQTTLTFDELIDVICVELALPAEGRPRVAKLRLLNQVLIAEASRGSTVVLLFDEAQHLGPEVLENVRLISNLEADGQKLIQIVLVGQPELQTCLDDPRLRQVRQRIALRQHLQPLSPEEVRPYIHHRLRVAGGRRSLFTDAAVQRVARYSAGLPRAINLLCHAALLLAYARDAAVVDARMVEEAARDLHLRPASLATCGRRRLPWAAGAAAGVAAVVGTSMLGPAALRPRPATEVATARPAGLNAGRPEPAIIAASSVQSPASAPALPSLPERPSSGAAASDATTPAVLPPRAGADARWNGRRTVVPPGGNIDAMAYEEYGARRLLGLDLVRELNPGIADLGRVPAGQPLWMPALSLDTLMRRQPDGTYQMIVSSHATPESAEQTARTIRRNGYRARVVPRAIATDIRVHRVTIEDLASSAAASQAWAKAQRLGWVARVEPTR